MTPCIRDSFRKGMRVRLRAQHLERSEGNVAAVAANLVLIWLDDGRTLHLLPNDASCNLEEVR